MLYKLKYDIFEEYNSTWCSDTRGNFDLFINGEPYLSLVMLINLDSSEYIVRVLGKSIQRGFYSIGEELEEVIKSTFFNTVTCVGNPGLVQDSSVIKVLNPFPMIKSASC